MYLTSHLSQIKQLCEQYKVERLYVFGSVLTDRFNAESDVDFLYLFRKDVPFLDYADNYFDFLYGLQDTLHRSVDLVSEKDLKNPYFIEELNKTKQLVYEYQN